MSRSEFVGDAIPCQWMRDAGATADAARAVVEQILGWDLDPRKSAVGSQDCVVLGVRVRVLGGERHPPRLLITLPEDKADRWAKDIQAALDHDRMSPAEARVLCGRLSWASSCVFGAVARPYAWPLHRRAEGGGPALSDRLRRALEWWRDFILSKPERMVELAPSTRRRVTVYTDAAGDGGVGLVAHTSDGVVWSASRVPRRVADRFRGRSNSIVAHELAAAAAALEWLCTEEGVEVLLFVDNQNVEAAIRKGYSRVRDLHEHASSIWRTAAARKQHLVVARVASGGNPADEPTRSGRAPRWLGPARQLEWAWA